MECKVAREVVGGARGPIVIIVEVIQCKVDYKDDFKDGNLF
jgi:hypothetical protein